MKALIHEMQKTERPIIVKGDFNDVGGLSVIKMIERSGLKDVWWQGCAGYGATIRSPLPYRIDYIFYNPNLTLLIVKKYHRQGFLITMPYMRNSLFNKNKVLKREEV